MVVRIDNVDKWLRLEVGKALALTGVAGRNVRLQLNCPAPTRVDLVLAGTVMFLGVVTGREDILFVAPEEQVQVTFTAEDDVWLFTNDGEQIASDGSEAVSFATIATRRARNPELDRMLFKQQENFERRMALQSAEIAAMMARLPKHDATTGEVDDGNDQAATGPTGGAVEPAAPGAVAAPDKGAEADGTA